MNLFQSAILRQNYSRPPVWFMRQAGRYHSHYQKLRARYSFMDLCKNPEIACEVAMGPIRDFNFDAAILFSDLLFPLEAMGMGLRYEPGPMLDWHLRDKSDLARLKGGQNLVQQLAFQAEALRLTREQLPKDKGLLGFVGGPLTLYCYAVEGRHQGDLASAKTGLVDGRFEGFFECLVDLLVANMVMQAEAGASAVAVMDTCAGEFIPDLYGRLVVPYLKIVLDRFKQVCPTTPVVYYSKGTGPAHWQSLKDLPIQALGIDWNHNIARVLDEWADVFAIQGNIDPRWLFLELSELELKLRSVFEEVQRLPREKLQGWICGLGHGVLPGTPEDGVRCFLRVQREIFG